MDVEKKGKQITIGADSRITTVGNFLRKYKLDELPQLIDVLVGDMSLVGPRPEVPKYIDCYSDDEKHDVLSVKPGITDNASIEFRDENELLSSSKDPEARYINKVLPKKIALYRKYVRERSFFGDLAIIFKSIFLIIKK